MIGLRVATTGPTADMFGVPIQFAINPIPEWTTDANCYDLSPHDADRLFFSNHVPREAVRMCKSCPVKADCLALGLWEDDGYWGGMHGSERKLMRTGARKAYRSGLQEAS